MHEPVREAVQDRKALDEIELFAELMAVATAARDRLSTEVIDRVLRVGAPAGASTAA